MFAIVHLFKDRKSFNFHCSFDTVTVIVKASEQKITERYKIELTCIQNPLNYQSLYNHRWMWERKMTKQSEKTTKSCLVDELLLKVHNIKECPIV